MRCITLPVSFESTLTDTPQPTGTTGQVISGHPEARREVRVTDTVYIKYINITDFYNTGVILLRNASIVSAWKPPVFS